MKGGSLLKIIMSRRPMPLLLYLISVALCTLLLWAGPPVLFHYLTQSMLSGQPPLLAFAAQGFLNQNSFRTSLGLSFFCGAIISLAVLLSFFALSSKPKSRRQLLLAAGSLLLALCLLTGG